MVRCPYRGLVPLQCANGWEITVRREERSGLTLIGRRPWWGCLFKQVNQRSRGSCNFQITLCSLLKMKKEKRKKRKERNVKTVCMCVWTTSLTNVGHNCWSDLSILLGPLPGKAPYMSGSSRETRCEALLRPGMRPSRDPEKAPTTFNQLL